MSTDVDGSANLADAGWELLMSKFAAKATTQPDQILEDNIQTRQMLVSLLGSDTSAVKDPKVAKVLLAAMKDNDASIFTSKRLIAEENDSDKAEQFRAAFLDILNSTNGQLPQAGGARAADDLDLEASIDDFELVEGETIIGDDIYEAGEAPEVNIPD